ncbi:CoA ester lyase [Verticiella sediminum]|uniref:CoA ester lyase n=1 Tax=Verticiella sediminum TaxID=1247510 RepID=A0A556AYU9_9BURK|nr:CoA ester lyase [Verticiella sediminum]TSH98111.1 CoA ester lyase [Verticiella sediminum]
MSSTTSQGGYAPLFVPATRTERIAKALAAGPDAVIVDLEDAVEAIAKESARNALGAFLAEHAEIRVVVRVNAAGTAEHETDLALCNAHPNVAGIMLAKAESAAEAAHAAEGGKAVWALVETVGGVARLDEIAATPGVERLVFGTLDFGVDAGLDAALSSHAVMLDHVRCRMVLASRLAGIAAPLDGVYTAIDDPEGLRASARHAMGLGMGGMLCIHPKQVPVVQSATAPSEEEVAWARRVIAEAERTGLGAFQLDGAMVDAPVIARARRIVQRAA